MVATPWSPEITKFLVRNGTRALYLNKGRGWDGNGGDYSFLAELTHLTLVSMLIPPADDLSPVAKVTSLERLSIDCVTRCPIDFLALPSLKQVSLAWWRGAASILDHRGVESLSLYGAKPDDWRRLRPSAQIRKLSLRHGNVSDLEFLSGWPDLVQLELRPARALRRVGALASLPRLRWLTLDEAHHIEDLESLAACNALRALSLNDLGRIPTLSFLRQLKGLEVLGFWGSTWIDDGDLSFLEELPNLTRLGFQNRRHYSHRALAPFSGQQRSKFERVRKAQR